MVELLKQPQYRPFNLADEIVSIFAGTKGYLDDLPVKEVQPFEAALLKHVNDEYPERVKEVSETGQLPDEVAENLGKVIAEFKRQWIAKRPKAAGASEAQQMGSKGGSTAAAKAGEKAKHG
jgi:F-type H+-transporting ATPase subunit alpha